MNSDLSVKTLTLSNPYKIKKMGTSGLRQKQEVYNQPLFLEQFVQGAASYFSEITERENIAENNKTILLGGDPRMSNKKRIDTIARILIGNGFRVMIAKKGLASTPAMSNGICKLKVAGGIILTASHNPYTDVGIKINNADGSPALEEAANRMHDLQNSVSEVKIADQSALNNGKYTEYVDIIKLYTELLDKIFDFNEMKSDLKKFNLKGAFDPMFGAGGPFAEAVFIDALGMDTRMIRSEPREDLGGRDEKGEPLHPEPDFDYIKELIQLNGSGGYDIVSAWDSDVDRRLNGGSGFFVESADEFTLFAKYSDLINIETLFENTIYFCRSTVTADTIDKMENFLKSKFSRREVKIVETPTGFKWIAELGNWGVEESNGVGNPYIREKDGIFASVFLLKILLKTGKTVKELVEDIWKEFGRVYFTRGEISGSDDTEKEQLARILNNAAEFEGKRFKTLTLESAGSWDYIHPVTGKTASKGAAWVLKFSSGNTIKARFSGTGSSGYTLRVYCSKYDTRYDIPKSHITQPMKEAFDEFLRAGGFNRKSEKYIDANQPDIYKR